MTQNTRVGLQAALPEAASLNDGIPRCRREIDRWQFTGPRRRIQAHSMDTAVAAGTLFAHVHLKLSFGALQLPSPT